VRLGLSGRLRTLAPEQTHQTSRIYVHIWTVPVEDGTEEVACAVAGRLDDIDVICSDLDRCRIPLGSEPEDVTQVGRSQLAPGHAEHATGQRGPWLSAVKDRRPIPGQALQDFRTPM
jgi:hypothetical protein